MLTNKRRLLVLFFSTVSLFFIFNFLNFFLINYQEQKNDDSLSLNNSSDFILDEIEPFCDGASFKKLPKDNFDISHIDINILNREKWYENMFNLSFESQRAIKLKYKKSYDAVLKVFFKNGLSCDFESIVRISGDWNDHINKENLISSLDVKLTEGNLIGVTKFKLFLPETRNNDNEIITTSILNELGFLTPRTFYIEVGTYNFSNNYIKNKYIFQEKPSKEFLEFNNLREAPIYETNESFVWDEVLNNTLKERRSKGLSALMMAKTLNKNWSIRGEPNMKISLLGLEKYNQAIFNSYNPGSQLNYKYLGDDLNVFYMYDAANIGLLAEHGLTNHNRRFFYNILENQFYPIYYDGNSNIIELGHIRGRADYENLDGIALGAKKIIETKQIDKENFHKALLNNGLDISKEASDGLLARFYNNISQISTYKNNKEINYRSFNENTKLISYNENFKFIFYDIKNNLLESCNYDLSLCETEEVEVEFSEILSNLVKTENNTGYLLSSDKTSFLNLSDNTQRNIIELDNFSIEIFGSPRMEIIDSDKSIKIYLSDLDQKIKIFGPGSMADWKIEISSNFKIDSQANRIDENLLTGCLTFYNLEIENLSIKSDTLFCEDAINFVNVNGYLEKLQITNSSFDGIDADFSNLVFKNVEIINSGNDCFDLSSGSYTIEFYSSDGCLDKSISVGEKSKVDITTANINNSFIGIAAKDSSEVNVESIDLNNIEMCFAAYRKKQEFGPSEINIDSFYCNSNVENFIQTGSVFNAGS